MKKRSLHEIGDALIALSLGKGPLKDKPAEFLAGVKDALTWAAGESGTEIGAAIAVSKPEPK